jgi:hypothetical protein
VDPSCIPRRYVSPDFRIVVGTPKIEKGKPISAYTANDLPKNDQVVAGLNALMQSALQDRRRAFEQGGSRESGLPGHPGKSAFPMPCKAAGKFVLVVAEDIDCKCASHGQVLDDPGAVIDANEHQRRL